MSRKLLAVLLLLVSTACGDRDRPRTAFDGQSAYRLVQTQVAFGPRVPGTDSHRRAGDWIAAQMRARADTVIEQRWTHVTAAGDSLPLRNILARFRPAAEGRVMYLAHWDSRPVAESARDSAQRKMPTPGANDGASGVAMLIALADVLAKTPPTVGVDLLFVDGEDYGDFDTKQDVLLGSRYFAEHPPSAEYRPLFGVLWDMIGDADLQIYQEVYSVRAAPEIVQRVWDQAAALGYGNVFIPQPRFEVYDDHVPLIEKGWRVIDVIDIEYPNAGGPTYHHTPQDLPDKVSPRSLQIVGDVATALLVEP